MLEQPVLAQARKEFSAHIGGRDDFMFKRLTENRSTSLRGIFVYADIASQELATRIGIAWNALTRAQHTFGKWTPTLAADLCDELKRLIEDQPETLQKAVLKLISNDPRMAQHSEQVLAECLRNKLAQCANEADYLARAEELRSAGNTPAGTSVTVHGSVGILQTGASSVAHLTINAVEAERLGQALDSLRDSIEAAQDIAQEERSQLLEVVKDVRQAVAATHPNPSKIRMLLSGIGAVVRTVASLHGAWTLVHDAAVAIPGLIQM